MPTESSIMLPRETVHRDARRCIVLIYDLLMFLINA